MSWILLMTLVKLETAEEKNYDVHCQMVAIV